MKEADKLYQAGFSQQEVRDYVNQEASNLKAAGFSDAEIRDYTLENFGMSTGYDEQLDADASTTLDIQTQEAYDKSMDQRVKAEVDEIVSLDDQPDLSWSDAFRLGFNRSTTGLALGYWDPKDQDPSTMSFGDALMFEIGQGLGDTPTTVIGGIGGGAAGGPVGAFGGAMAVTEMTRAHLMGLQKRGSIDTAGEAFEHALDVTYAGASSMLTGSVVGKTGQLAAQSAKHISAGVMTKPLQLAAQPAVEVATMASMSSTLNLEMPTMRDLALAGIQVGGERLGGFYTDKLAYSWQKHGTDPKSLIAYANKNLAAKEDLVSGNMEQIQEQGGNYTPLYQLEYDRPVEGESPSIWMHTDRNIAGKVADGVNKKHTSDAEKYIAAQREQERLSLNDIEAKAAEQGMTAEQYLDVMQQEREAEAAANKEAAEAKEQKALESLRSRAEREFKKENASAEAAPILTEKQIRNTAEQTYNNKVESGEIVPTEVQTQNSKQIRARAEEIYDRARAEQGVEIPKVQTKKELYDQIKAERQKAKELEDYIAKAEERTVEPTRDERVEKAGAAELRAIAKEETAQKISEMDKQRKAAGLQASNLSKNEISKMESDAYERLREERRALKEESKATEDEAIYQEVDKIQSEQRKVLDEYKEVRKQEVDTLYKDLVDAQRDEVLSAKSEKDVFVQAEFDSMLAKQQADVATREAYKKERTDELYNQFLNERIAKQQEKAAATEAKRKPPSKVSQVNKLEDLPVKQVKSYAVPADAKWINIYSYNDPNLTSLYNQYMTTIDPEHKASNSEDTRQKAVQLWHQMPEGFTTFLQSGQARMGVKGDEVVTQPIGVMLKDRRMVFDTSQLIDGEILEMAGQDLLLATEAIQASVSTDEQSSRSAAQVATSTYMEIFDRFQSLNSDASVGQVTMPYMMSRLLQGNDGLVRQWLMYDRTAFTPVSTRGDFGGTRQTTGKGLAEILNDATSVEMPKFSDTELASLTEISTRISDATKASSEAQIKELENIRDSVKPSSGIKDDISNALKGKLTKEQQARYEEAKMAVLAADEQLGNINDPLNLFRTYLIAKRANEMHARGEETGIDSAHTLAVAKHPEMIKAYEAAAQELYAFQRALLKYRYDAGLISKKAYDKVLSENKNYIPMHRVLDDGDPRIMATGTYAIKGSTRDIIDPFESIIRQTQYTLHDAERNQVYRLIGDEYGIKGQVKDKYKGFGTVAEFNELRAKERGASAEKSIKYRVNGKTKQVEVPYDIWKASQQLDPTSAGMNNALLRGASFIASLKRATTTIHPDFTNRNFIIDQFSAAINSDSGYKAFFDFGKGLATMVSAKTGKPLFPNADKYFTEWLRHGGSSANLVSQDRKYTQEIRDTLLKSSRPQNSIPFNERAISGLKQALNPANWPKAAFRALQKASEMSEDGTRLGEYVRAREQGISPFEAAYRSREVTMDYKRMGASTKALNAMSVFLNARLQGADRSIRQMVGNPIRTMNRITAGIILPSIILAMVREDYIHNDPDSEMAMAIRETPQWQKDMYWLVPTGVGLFRIPKPHEYGLPFANPVESFVEHMYQASPDKSFLSKLMDEGYFGLIADQYLLGSQTLSATVPTASLPLLENLVNYNMFTGQPIIPPSMERLLPEARYNRNTTQLAKGLSQLLSEISPDIDTPFAQKLRSPVAIDNLVQGYLGSVGRDMWKMLDVAAQKAGLVEQVVNPAKDLADVPFIKAFMVKFPNSGSESVNRFYEEATAIEQKLATIQFYAKQPNANARERMMYLATQGGFGSVTSMREAITGIGRQITYIDAMPDMSPEDKARLIDQMYVDMIRIARAGRQVIQQIKTQTKE